MPSAGWCPRSVMVPAWLIAAFSRATAATGAAAPSSAQFSPPNAIMDAPATADAYATSAPSESRWSSAADPSAQSTRPLAASTSARLVSTERSRILVASYCSRCRWRLLARKRSRTQSGSPKIRTSLAAGGSTASRKA